MPSEALCENCLTAFRGESIYNADRKEFSHHLSAESFRKALDLPCAICVRLLISLQRYHGEDSPSHLHCIADADAEFANEETFALAPTTYQPLILTNKDAQNTLQALTFQCGPLGATLTFEPCTDRSQYQIPFTGNTGSRDALEFHASQYRECIESHHKCQTNHSSGTFIPTRLIDIGTDSSMVLLCESDSVPSGAEYVALSHCWGGSQPLTLTKGTAPKLTRGISISSLPKTFRDAITVTKAMCFKYLWIDSLCIYQDEEEDWFREASRMHNVYSKAACCIAATAAKSSDEGLFFDRDPQGLSRFIVEVTWDQVETRAGFPPPGEYWCGTQWIGTNIAIDMAPLNKRAWVAQERYLSPRILHFTKELLYWECREKISSEVFPTHVPDYSYAESKIYDVTYLKRLVDDYRACHSEPDLSSDTDEKALSEIYNAWCTFRSAYTGFGLTKENDMLVALAGIAQDVGEATGDTMIAGLWKNFFVEELCWDTHSGYFYKNAELSQWRAPSWSWASRKLPITPSEGQEIRSKYDYAVNLLEVVSFSVQTRVSRALDSASVFIQCCPIPAKLQKPYFGTGWLLELTHRSPDGPVPVVFSVTLDSETINKETSDMHVVLVRRFFNENRPDIFLEGLVLKHYQETKECYKRIGVFHKTHDLEIITRILQHYRFAPSHLIELI